jgi:hypothetical protein
MRRSSLYTASLLELFYGSLPLPLPLISSTLFLLSPYERSPSANLILNSGGDGRCPVLLMIFARSPLRRCPRTDPAPPRKRICLSARLSVEPFCGQSNRQRVLFRRGCPTGKCGDHSAPCGRQRARLNAFWTEQRPAAQRDAVRERLVAGGENS